jgi:pyruvate/2-oxoglutarate dehydrogenase complex dihydrolipoamide dehydrogenase (E3) component
VIRAGEAGQCIAWELTEQGRDRARDDRGLPSNIACLPSTKAILSAQVAHLVRNAASAGLKAQAASVDLEVVRRRKREMVDVLIALHQQKFARPHLECLFAQGRLIGPRTVEVTFPDIAAFQTTMLGSMPHSVLRDAILAHLTIAEGLNVPHERLT